MTQDVLKNKPEENSFIDLDSKEQSRKKKFKKNTFEELEDSPKRKIKEKSEMNESLNSWKNQIDE